MFFVFFYLEFYTRTIKAASQVIANLSFRRHQLHLVRVVPMGSYSQVADTHKDTPVVGNIIQNLPM